MTESNERQTAVSRVGMMSMAHGMVFPDGLPECAMCHLSANSPVHINPAKSSSLNRTLLPKMLAADRNPLKRMPIQSHPYSPMSSTLLRNVRCGACGNGIDSGAHVAGMPVGAVGSTTVIRAADEESMGEIEVTRHAFVAIEGRDDNDTDPDYQMCAKCGFAQDNNIHISDDDPNEGSKTVRLSAFHRERKPDDTPTPVSTVKAFVAMTGNRIVIAGRANTLGDIDQLPRELAASWEARAHGNPAYLWLEGRYVEADKPNRNKAMWTSDDLELGQPSVAFGPLNWLHAERHVVGTIADSALVQSRVAADASPVGNHIRALAAAWPWLYPTESRLIQAASDDGTLWFSMECVSRTAACQSEGCDHSQTYREYMLQPQTRCEHIRQGAAATRFADPMFLGGAVIVPPVKPGWAAAEARVMKVAANLAERQAAAFDGMTTSDAELLVAQIIGGTA